MISGNAFFLSKGVKYESGFIIDTPLERKAEVNLPVDVDTKKKLNSMYFVNVMSLSKSIINNLPYRIDVSGRSFISILVKLFCSVSSRGIIQFCLLLSIFGVTSNNLWLVFVALFILDIILSFCFHEALHLFFFRCFAKCDAGATVVKGLQFFTVYPRKQSSPTSRLIIAGAPSTLALLVGLLVVVLAKVIAPATLICCLLIVYALPWLIQILSLIPGTTDFSGVAEAVKLLMRQKV